MGRPLGADETDLTVDADRVRDPMAPVRNATEFPGEKRWNPRYACSGGASIKTEGSKFAIHGEVKGLSNGGISQVNVEGSQFLRLDEYPVSLLASACDMLAADLDEWKSIHSVQELEQVRKAVSRLHEKLLQAVSPIDLLDYFATTVPHDGRTQ